MVQKKEKGIDNTGGTGCIKRSVSDFREIVTSNQRNIMKIFEHTNKGELFVLQQLAISDAPMLPKELSEALKSSTARISAILGALENKGYIERSIDKRNRRNILVTLTDSGREVIIAEMNAMEARLTKVFTEMGETDTVDFVRLIGKFFSVAQKYVDEI